MRRVYVAVVLALSACAASPPSPPAQGLTLGAAALYPNGSPLEISFGRHVDGALEVTARLLGAPFDAIRPCGAGVTVAPHPVGLILAFQDNHLSGWHLTGDGIATRMGISVGTRLAQVPQDGLRYALDSDGTVVSISAGSTWSSDEICPV